MAVATEVYDATGQEHDCMTQLLATSDRSAAWMDELNLARFVLPAQLAQVMTATGSLTERLRSASKHSFSVRVLRQEHCSLSDFPNQCLAGQDGTGLLREVHLMCNGQAVVFAQTLIPDETLQAHPWLAELGEEPLGQQLFSRSDVEREAFEFARLAPDDPLLGRAGAGLAQTHAGKAEVWARRSVFLVSGCPVSVNEVFFPGAMPETGPGK